MKALIFGTVYADTEEKAALARLWCALHGALNPGCDLLLVDSASPVALTGRTMQLGDNIGHLARGGGDGWGRAFCAGLQYAVARRYDYVAHIEGDSLFRLPVAPIFELMGAADIAVASVPARGTKRVETDWVETGLMLFSTAFVTEARVVERYDWRAGSTKQYPRAPEWHVHQLVEPRLSMMSWRAERGDSGQITLGNVGDYDWITHVTPDVHCAFAERAMR